MAKATKTTTKKATKKTTTKKTTAAKKADSKKETTKAKVIDLKTKQEMEVGMKLEAIKALENAGFKRWRKGNHDRLYISPGKLGLRIEENGSTFMGEPIESKESDRMRAAKTYIDVNTGEVCSGNDKLESAAAALYSKVLALKEVAEVTEAI